MFVIMVMTLYIKNCNSHDIYTGSDTDNYLGNGYCLLYKNNSYDLAVDIHFKDPILKHPYLCKAPYFLVIKPTNSKI